MATKTKPLTLDTFRAANTAGRGGGCSLARFLGSLGSADRHAIQEALADPSIQARAIHKVIAPLGFECSEQVVRRHRQGLCPVCPR